MENKTVKANDFWEEIIYEIECPYCGSTTNTTEDPNYIECINCIHCNKIINIETE